MVTIDPRVESLITAEAEYPDELMKELQDDLRRGNRHVAEMLAAAFHERRFEPDARGLALETLAAARVRWFEPQTLELVRTALEAPEPELRFAAIAAAGDLSHENQVAVSGVVRSLIASPDADASGPVRQAAEAFLRRVDRSTRSDQA